jgi:hypothetical protein
MPSRPLVGPRKEYFKQSDFKILNLFYLDSIGVDTKNLNTYTKNIGVLSQKESTYARNGR